MVPDDPRGRPDQDDAPDRLGDLGAGRHEPPPGEEPAAARDDERSAAERFAELDVTQPEEETRTAKPTPTPKPSRVYSYLMGVAFVLAVILAYLAIRPGSGESLRGPEPGEVVPDFAAASATGRSGADANVKQGDFGGDARDACDVRGPDAINICDLRARAPLVITFAFTRAADCERDLDQLERIRRDFEGVTFVGVFSGEKREKVAELVRERGWRFPVAVDPDGAVANVYGIGVCPTTTFAFRGGEVKENKLGRQSDEEFREQVRDLLEAQRNR